MKKRKNTKKIFFRITALVFALAAAMLLAMYFFPNLFHRTVERPEAEIPEIRTEYSEPETEPQVEEAPPYESPIDFASLKEECSDIYAWITIPGTKVDNPVVRNVDDPDYYLRRDIYGEYLFAGTLYTQSNYNGDDFSDRVTIIYGHNMLDGTMFGDLQSLYSNEETFNQLDRFIVYLPDREIHYEVIAAIPFSNLQIMDLNNRFEEEEDVKTFLNYAMNVHSMMACKKEGYEPTGEERLVILQTCQYGTNGTARYIVIGKETEDY